MFVSPNEQDSLILDLSCPLVLHGRPFGHRDLVEYRNKPVLIAARVSMPAGAHDGRRQETRALRSPAMARRGHGLGARLCTLWVAYLLLLHPTAALYHTASETLHWFAHTARKLPDRMRWVCSGLVAASANEAGALTGWADLTWGVICWGRAVRRRV
jgi:hypothetical protein